MEFAARLARRLLLSGALAATGFAPAQTAGPAPRTVVHGGVEDFTVFLDPPTGYVFLKLPAGWKFVGQVAPESLAHLKPLPCHLVTRLPVPTRRRARCQAAWPASPPAEVRPVTPADSIGAFVLE